MYNIGNCKICKQGILEIVKEEKTNKLFIYCDECEAEFENPENALEGKNGIRYKHDKMKYPTLEEIKEHWNIDVYEHHN